MWIFACREHDYQIPPLSQYEKDRLKRIEKNKKEIAEIIKTKGLVCDILKSYCIIHTWQSKLITGYPKTKREQQKGVCAYSVANGYRIVGKLGREKLWQICSFWAFGGKKFGEWIDQPIGYQL